MNEQTIEMQIRAKAQEALQSLNKLTSQLTGVEKKIDGVKTTIDKVSTTKARNEMNSLNSSIEKASKSMEKFKNLFTFVGAKRLTKTALGWMNEAIDYTEQLNLFNVVFKNIEKNGTTMYSNLGKEAVKYQNKLNEAFGTNKTQSLYTQAIYQSMAENQGISDYYSKIMSETMTNFTYDLASLYNKSDKTTAEALRASVFAGMTKPARNYGLDVTQQSMQPILTELGIDKQVKELSQGEKMILRYITVLKQGQVAMADFASTVESPSNQLKIFRQQLVEAKVAMSSLFIGGLANILPYANAFLMVVKEVSKAIADMFGIKLVDYNSGIASQEDAFVDLGDSVDDAIGKVKELKRQTLGFDEIHNINENKDSGSGTSISGGIDQRLLDAIKGYDNGMDKVRMKATEIRDRIMEWLGFTKEIDPLTGEIGFKYQGMKTTLKNVWTSFKNLNTQGKILVGLGLVTGALKLWNAGKKLTTVLGSTGLVKVIKNLITPFKNLTEYTRVYTSITGTLKDGIIGGIDAWRKQSGIISETTGKFTGWTSIVNGGKIALEGLVTAGLGLYTVHESMKNLSTEGFNLANALGLVGGSITTIASGVQIGAIFGPWGAAIGGAVGAVADLISILDGYETQSEKTRNEINKTIDKTKAYSESLIEQHNNIDEELQKQTALSNAHQNLLNELQEITDANGRIKVGYEERASFIVTTLNNAYGTEIKIVDNVIQKYDEQISKIKSLIDEKKKELYLSKAEESYNLAIEKRAETYENLKEANDAYLKSLKAQTDMEEKYRKQWEKIPSLIKSWYGSFERYLDKESKAVNDDYYKLVETANKAKINLDEATSAYDSNTKAIMNYNGLLSADTEENSELINYYMNEIDKRYNESENNIKDTYSKQLEDAKEYYESVIRISGESESSMSETTRAEAESRYNSVISALKNELNYINGTTDETAQAWYTLSKSSKDKFLENFNQLPEDIQQQVIDKMYSKGYSISQELQNGINAKIPTIKFNIDTSSLSSFLKTGFNQQLSWLGINTKANGGVFSNGSWKNIPQYANGGIPSHGSMFVAGEHGAEIVGHINGKTEVLNQSQIANAIYNAIVSAMSQYSGQTSEIDVHVHTDEGTVIDRIEQRTKQTGQFPFTIPTY